MSSYEDKSSVRFEESPEKKGAAPDVFGSNEHRTSQESLMHQASGKFGSGLGARPPAPADHHELQQKNDASSFSKPKFSSINSNA